MYSLTPSLEERFKLYLNILPVVEKAAMYLLFLTAACLILVTVYILTFKVMFKTFDQKKQRNFAIPTHIWTEKETRNKDSIYAPCEIPLDDTESDSSDPQLDTDRRPSLLKVHSDRIKELSHKLSDKMYDTAGSVRDKVRDEITHVKNIFTDRKNSLINESSLNDGYRTDSCDDEKRDGYAEVGQTDSEDDCKYLEVLDDGSGFDSTEVRIASDRSKHLKQLDSGTDELLHISD